MIYDSKAVNISITNLNSPYTFTERSFVEPKIVEPESDEPPETKKDNRKIRLLGYSGAAALHGGAAIARLLGLKSEKLDVFEKIALRTSKTVHTIIYSLLAKDAFRKGRALDAIAKILDPLISNFSSVGNMNLSKGISGGLQILDFSQAKHGDQCPDFMKNLANSFKLTKTMAKEIYSKDSLTENRKIFVAPEKEEGHSLALSGHGVLASSILGLMFKPLNKSMNFIRNASAMLSNTIAMQHPDSQKNISGLLFNSYSVLDTVQKFLSKPKADFLNQVNMAIYNIAIFLYGDLSNKRSLEQFENY
ncbi:MAG: hypothetical protein HRT47_02075 [Candidatus Caenarcaniphilales bacterium]|nr:hypothetical protein [Candidatus Caenarcaniphilales bacterium]